ncbi:MAG: hypothetical protein IJP27_08790 [Clostridia bacterium]|nr:hypothetical protein [Clostridia bacterium]
MKRRLFALTIALILLLSTLCSVPAFAAKESFISIKEVAVNEISSPAAGTEPLFSANTTTKFVQINSVNWYEKKTESEGGTALASGDKFKPGYFYTVRVEVGIANNAYYFDSNGNGVTATVNGKTAKTVSLGSAQKVAVDYTFPMCLGTVSKFDITLTAPAAGAAPSYPKVTGTGYESNNSRNNGAAFQNGISWHNDTDNAYLYPAEGDKFEAGKKYTARVFLLTTTGYRLSSSYTVTVNGKAVTAGIDKVDNECLTVDYSFTVPAAQEDPAPPAGGNTNEQPAPPANPETPNGNSSSSADKTPSKPDTSDQPTQQKPSEDTSTDAPVVSDPVTPADPEAETPETPENGEEPKDPPASPLPWILAGAALLIAIGAVVALILLRKKK